VVVLIMVDLVEVVLVVVGLVSPGQVEMITDSILEDAPLTHVVGKVAHSCHNNPD